MKNVGKAIRVCRAARGWTQAALADRVPLGYSMLSLVERDKRDLSLDSLERVCQALDIPQYLFMAIASDVLDGPAAIEVVRWIQRAK